MALLRVGLLLVHISAAALLLGGALGVKQSVLDGLELGQRSLLRAAEGFAKRGRIMGVASIATLLTGVALMFVSFGGFGGAPKNFHTALLTMLVAIGVSAVLLRPAGAVILSEAQKAEPSREIVLGQLKKVSMAQGILHLLWLVTLTLMFVHYL